jgi:hypothetical protein
MYVYNVHLQCMFTMCVYNLYTMYVYTCVDNVSLQCFFTMCIYNICLQCIFTMCVYNLFTVCFLHVCWQCLFTMFVYNVCLQYVLDMFIYNICVQILQEHINGNSINDMSGTLHPYCYIYTYERNCWFYWWNNVSCAVGVWVVWVSSWYSG